MSINIKQPIAKLLPIQGVKIGVASAGIKQQSRLDLTLLQIEYEQARVAGVFTQNAFCAAPVVIAKNNIKYNPKALIINTGNANAATGDKGLQDAQECCQALACALDIQDNQVLPFSTGVIGELLPVEKIVNSVHACMRDLHEDNWNKAATAIMTTDTVEKGISKQFVSQGTVFTITGIAKGSGMIKPNMATMLSFIATDATVVQEKLQDILCRVIDKTFNAITVDGDTSTNDSCILIATGAKATIQDEAFYVELEHSLHEVALYLAHCIVRDGEGATKFVTINVNNARNTEESKDAAYAIAHSLLVKTALFASDPNWGRIAAVIGRSVSDLDIKNTDIFINGMHILKNGGLNPDYKEEQITESMKQIDIDITVMLNLGNVSSTVWTTDLSHDYVSINASYRS